MTLPLAFSFRAVGYALAMFVLLNTVCLFLCGKSFIPSELLKRREWSPNKNIGRAVPFVLEMMQAVNRFSSRVHQIMYHFTRLRATLSLCLAWSFQKPRPRNGEWDANLWYARNGPRFVTKLQRVSTLPNVCMSWRRQVENRATRGKTTWFTPIRRY